MLAVIMTRGPMKRCLTRLVWQHHLMGDTWREAEIAWRFLPAQTDNSMKLIAPAASCVGGHWQVQC